MTPAQPSTDEVTYSEPVHYGLEDILLICRDVGEFQLGAFQIKPEHAIVLPKRGWLSKLLPSRFRISSKRLYSPRWELLEQSGKYKTVVFNGTLEDCIRFYLELRKDF